MIDMNIEVKSKVILLPSFFIAISVLCIGIPQFVEASLPNQNRLNAIPCVRELFGEGFLRESFRKKEDKLSDGEYFGAACEDLDGIKIKEAIRNKVLGTYDYDGEKIKNCLKKNNHLGLFGIYQANGLLHKLRNRSGSGSDAQTSENQADAPGEPEEDTLDDVSELLTSAIYYFFRGMCESKDEEVEFEKVIAEKEKKEVLACLAQCTGKFLIRVEHILLSGKAKALELLQQKIKYIKNTKLRSPNDDTDGIVKQLADEEVRANEINGLYDKLEKRANIDANESADLFLDAYEKSDDTIKSIELIENIAKKYLHKDSRFYYYVNFGIKNYDEEIALAKFDENLYVTFSIYQDCSRIGCGMTLNSTPLFNQIVQGSKDRFEQGSLKQKIIVTAQDLNLYKPKRRTFFKALVELPKKSFVD